jgi:ribonuclease J
MGDAHKDIEPNAIILLTGCQGEFKGALRRVSTGENSYFKPQPTDLFIFSSKTIPGNAKAISQVMNNISEFQAKIITEKDILTHVSGHPGQEDLKLVIESYNPTNYIPVHGESFFLQRQVEWINSTFPQINTHFVLNNSKIDVSSNTITVAPLEAKVPLIIHGKNLILERPHVSERRKIASQGLIIVVINLKLSSFDIEFIGLPDYFKTNYSIELEKIIQYYFSAKIKYNNTVLEQIRIEIRRIADKYLGYRPIVLVKGV